MSNPVLSIAEVLSKIDDGGALEEVRRALKDCVLACTNYKGKGSVTLKLAVECTKTGRIVITDSVSVTTPKRPTEPTLFFATEDGDLSRSDPKQLQLREINEQSN